MRHKHADLIHAWAEGAEIQRKNGLGDWVSVVSGHPWDVKAEYRIKLEPKPDVVSYLNVYEKYVGFLCDSISSADRSQTGYDRVGLMKLTFDGETGKLKSAEVIK